MATLIDEPARSSRVFLALWPEDAVRRSLVQHAAQWRWPDGSRPYAPQDLHLTLHFIGALPLSRLGNVGTALAVHFSPFDLCLDQVALWPRGLAVLCPSVLPEALDRLHSSLAQSLLSLDLPVEARAFRPHVTLAREARLALVPERPTPVSWHVQGYALVRSTGRSDCRYEVLRRYGAGRT